VRPVLNFINVLEDNGDLLEFKWKQHNIPFWLVARPLVLVSVMREIYGLHPAVHRSQTLKYLITYVVKYTPYMIKNNPMKTKNSSIIIFSNSRYNILKNDKYFNTMSDYFAQYFNRETAILESSDGFRYNFPRLYDNLYLEDYLRFLTNIHAKASIIKDYKETIARIKTFVKYVKYKLSHLLNLNLNPKFYEHLENYLIKWGKRINFYEYYYKKFFERAHPKIILTIMNGGSGLYGLITKFAKDLGIRVGEIQHGVITKVHPGYNYGEALLRSKEYNEFFPDYLLTYGNFWNENTNIPAKKITIGKPHLEYKLKEYETYSWTVNNKKKVLVISQGLITKVMVELTEKLSKKLEGANYEIIFRLHPGEVHFEELYRSLYRYSNITINRFDDIYDLISKSNYVVGCASTVIYEAIAFKKPIFILRNKLSKIYIPSLIGYWFDNAEELYELVTSDVSPKEPNNVEYYWKPNWKDNYKNFIAMVLRKAVREGKCELGLKQNI